MVSFNFTHRFKSVPLTHCIYSPPLSRWLFPYLNLQQIRVRRVFDKEANNVIYTSFSTRLDKGSDKNKARYKSSMCAVHLNLWTSWVPPYYMLICCDEVILIRTTLLFCFCIILLIVKLILNWPMCPSRNDMIWLRNCNSVTVIQFLK